MGDLIQFPSKLNKYVNFKTDEKETEKFNKLIEKVFASIEETYPELEEIDPSDYVLIAEAITSAAMRAKGIDHPFQDFADKNMVTFFEEYGL